MSSKQNPILQWAFNVLRLFCPPQLYEEIEGDLIQKFEKDCKDIWRTKSKNKINLEYIRFSGREFWRLKSYQNLTNISSSL